MTASLPLANFSPTSSSSSSASCHLSLPTSPHSILLPRFKKHTNSGHLYYFSPSPPLLRRPFNNTSPPPALDSDAHHPADQGLNKGSSFGEQSVKGWDSLTSNFAGAANIPFLLMQLPQITLNARNLAAGNRFALFAVPWIGMLNSLMGNLIMLSYFAKKKETEAMIIQTLGVVTAYVVVVQLAIAGAMPLPQFMATSTVVTSGLLLNLLNYFNLLPLVIWKFWEDFITIVGLSILPQVMWSTFVPFIPYSILPGTIAFLVAVGAVVMARTGKLSEKGVKLVGMISGWTATLFFMWMPIAQMWTNFLNPDNIRGLSAFTILLAMIGNSLMIPRALFIRDFMWFTGATWASLLYGWGNLVCMYCFSSITKEFFSAATLGLFTWLGITLWRDSKAYGYTSPMTSLKKMVFGT